MRVIAIVGAIVVLAAGCSNDQTSPTPGPVNQPSASASSAPTSTSATPTVDPYKVYLANAPKGEKTLSREDASTRALLGCQTKWPAGTVDAVLQQAYAAYCK